MYKILICFGLLVFCVGIVSAQLMPQLPVPKKADAPKPAKTPATKSATTINYATIKFLCDVDGVLFIDGEKKGDLKKDVPLHIKLVKGDYIIKAVSAANSDDQLNIDYSVTETGNEKIVRFGLQAIITLRQNEEAAKKKVTVFKEPEMSMVQGGSFNMGSESGNASEKPLHRVTVNSYKIGKYEVTVGQFRQFIQATGYRTTADDHGGSYIWNGIKWVLQAGINWEFDSSGIKRPMDQDSHPVVHVSWDDAVRYAQWLSSKTGKSYRLPTEAEWEYAARGGNQSRGYAYSGGDNLDAVAWYANNSGKQTHPVGQKQANELGVFDMTGNIIEWCSDWYDEKYYSNSPENNPQGAESGRYHVLRGGCWFFSPAICRVAYRCFSSPDLRNGDGGFRLVLSL